MNVAKHRLFTIPALAALIGSLAFVWVGRRRAHHSTLSHVGSVTSAQAAAAEAPRAKGRVEQGAATMIHLDPRHTNRSPSSGPAEPKLSWTFDTGGPVEAAPALLPDGTIVVASLGGKVHGVSPDGRARFQVDLNARVYSSPLVFDGHIFVGADGGKFFALRPNGTIRWRMETDGDADTGAVPTPWGAIVFASGKVLYAVRSDGTLVWRVKARRKIYTSPAVGDDGTVFFGSQDDHVYAVQPDGKIRWNVAVGADVDGSPAVADDGTVFIGTDGTEILALSPEDGSIRWRTRVGGFVRGTLSITRDGTVLAGTYGPAPMVLGLLPENGQKRFEFGIPGTGASEFGIHGAPVEDAEGRLYFGGQDDCVYALSAEAHMIWKFRTGGDVDAPLVLTPGGLLLAGSEDGRLYALEGNSH